MFQPHPVLPFPLKNAPGHEVTTINGEAWIAPKGVAVFNPAFDVTPAEYITGIITEQGVVPPDRIAEIFKR